MNHMLIQLEIQKASQIHKTGTQRSHQGQRLSYEFQHVCTALEPDDFIQRLNIGTEEWEKK